MDWLNDEKYDAEAFLDKNYRWVRAQKFFAAFNSNANPGPDSLFGNLEAQKVVSFFSFASRIRVFLFYPGSA